MEEILRVSKGLLLYNHLPTKMHILQPKSHILTPADSAHPAELRTPYLSQKQNKISKTGHSFIEDLS